MLALRTEGAGSGKADRHRAAADPLSCRSSARATAKNIAQVQEQAASLLKSVDGLTNRFLVVEEISHRNRQNVEDLVTIRTELQQQQRRFLEEMQMADQQRQRMVKEWEELEEAREQRMHEFAEQMRLYSRAVSPRSRARWPTWNRWASACSASSTRSPSCSAWPRSDSEPRWKSGRRRRRSAGSGKSCSGSSSGTTTTGATPRSWSGSSIVDERSEVNEEQIVHLWDVVADDMRQQVQAIQNRMIKHV